MLEKPLDTTPEKRPYWTYVTRAAAGKLGERIVDGGRKLRRFARKMGRYALYGGFPGWYQEELEKKLGDEFNALHATRANALFTVPVYAAATWALLQRYPDLNAASGSIPILAAAAGAMEVLGRLMWVYAFMFEGEPCRSVLLMPVYAAYRAAGGIAEAVRDFGRGVSASAKALSLAPEGKDSLAADDTVGRDAETLRSVAKKTGNPRGSRVEIPDGTRGGWPPPV